MRTQFTGTKKQTTLYNNQIPHLLNVYIDIIADKILNVSNTEYSPGTKVYKSIPNIVSDS